MAINCNLELLVWLLSLALKGREIDSKQTDVLTHDSTVSIKPGWNLVRSRSDMLWNRAVTCIAVGDPGKNDPFSRADGHRGLKPEITTHFYFYWEDFNLHLRGKHALSFVILQEDLPSSREVLSRWWLQLKRSLLRSFYYSFSKLIAHNYHWACNLHQS